MSSRDLVRRLPPRAYQQVSRTDAEGKWRFEGLVPGATYQVYGFFVPAGQGETRANRWLRQITVEPGQVLDLGQLKPATAPG